MCEACHTVEGFTPSRYTIEDHQKTRYPPGGRARDGRLRLVPPEQARADLAESSLNLQAPQGRAARASLQQRALCHCRPHRPLRDVPQRHARRTIQGERRPEGQELPAVPPGERLQQSGLRPRQGQSLPPHGQAPDGHLRAVPQGRRIKGVAVVRYRPRDRAAPPVTPTPTPASSSQGRHPGGLRHLPRHGVLKPAKVSSTRSPSRASSSTGGTRTWSARAVHRDVQVDETHLVRQYVGVPTTCEGCHEDFHHGEFKGFVP